MAQNQMKTVVQLLRLLLLFSCILPLFAAPPLPRMIALTRDKLAHQVWRRSERMQMEEEGFRKGRMSIELEDYQGGPNPRHDPKSPGKPN